MSVLICGYNVATPYGHGVGPLWDGIASGKTAISECLRFDTDNFTAHNAGLVPSLDAESETSIVLQMLTALFNANDFTIPSDAHLITASTVGEIDLLERSVIADDNSKSSALSTLPARTAKLLGLDNAGILISAACASGTTALAQAMTAIESGQEDCVVVVAVDCVSEFVFAGFSTLMALDPDIARPFDKDRAGLTAGEGAGCFLLMSEERAARENVQPLARIAGAGLTNDANHMTGPSRDGSGLARAITRSLDSANISADEIGFIAAHGTGTQFNDSMEMKAFKTVFPSPLPIFSIKGATGHSMGATGVIQSAVSLRAMSDQTVPPTVGMNQPGDDAEGWVSPDSQTTKKQFCIVVNAGFGGINAAIVLENLS